MVKHDYIILYYIERAQNALIFHSHEITMTCLNHPIKGSLSLLVTLVKSDLACGFLHQTAEAKAMLSYLFPLLKTGCWTDLWEAKTKICAWAFPPDSDNMTFVESVQNKSRFLFIIVSWPVKRLYWDQYPAGSTAPLTAAMAHSEFYIQWCFFKLLVTLGFHSSLAGDNNGRPVLGEWISVWARPSPLNLCARSRVDCVRRPAHRELLKNASWLVATSPRELSSWLPSFCLRSHSSTH